MLRWSDCVTVLLNASATRIGLDQAGTAVDSVSTATLDGRRIEVRASRVVLACGGLKNARMLRASRDRAPGGIANDHDVVGRYFMDHPRAVFGKTQVPSGTQFPLLRGRPLSRRTGSAGRILPFA
jgi:choline dehydrogenase-like flavoprotein